MKIWVIYYECSGVGGSGHIHLTADDLKQVCRDFDRWWIGRQGTDAAMGNGDAWFGDLFSAKVFPWSPWSVDQAGQLQENFGEARGGLEWKIDGSAAGFTFLQWAEMH